MAEESQGDIHMKIVDYLLEAMKDARTGFPSSKRVGHIAGISVSAVAVLVFVGIVAGLSIDVDSANYQFLVSQLLNTIIFLAGMLMGAGTTAYITTKRTEGKGNEQP
jgi:hypothetical protein